MKQIVIISGKGGTGKTMVAAGIISLLDNCVVADCDVDASNLYLLIKPEIERTQIFKGSLKSAKETKECNACGECIKVCRFNAIVLLPDKTQAKVLDYFCRGCELCTFVCPREAIYMTDTHNSGKIFIGDSKYGQIVYAELEPGELGSGKLVTIVRKYAEEQAIKNNKDFIVIDGSPGIGCPVIASITGCDLALIVTEPTKSALNDLKRIVEVSLQLQVKPVICINKYDLNLELTAEIELYCQNNNLKVISKLPYDENVTEFINRQEIITEKESVLSDGIKKLTGKLKELGYIN